MIDNNLINKLKDSIKKGSDALKVQLDLIIKQSAIIQSQEEIIRDQRAIIDEYKLSREEFENIQKSVFLNGFKEGYKEGKIVNVKDPIDFKEIESLGIAKYNYIQ